MFYALIRSRLFPRITLSKRNLSITHAAQSQRVITEDAKNNAAHNVVNDLNIVTIKLQQLETRLTNYVTQDKFQETSKGVDSLKQSLEEHANKIQIFDNAAQESKNNIEQVKRALLNIVGFFEKNIQQSKLELQQVESTQEKEPIEIRAAKIGARATREQSVLLFLSLIISFAAYVLSRDQDMQKKLKKDVQDAKEKEEKIEQVIGEIETEKNKLANENKELERYKIAYNKSTIFWKASLPDSMNVIKENEGYVKKKS